MTVSSLNKRNKRIAQNKYGNQNKTATEVNTYNKYLEAMDKKQKEKNDKYSELDKLFNLNNTSSTTDKWPRNQAINNNNNNNNNRLQDKDKIDNGCCSDTNCTTTTMNTNTNKNTNKIDTNSKKTVDLIIKKILENYTDNGLDNSFFTGINQEDLILSKLDTNNPNLSINAEESNSLDDADDIASILLKLRQGKYGSKNTTPPSPDLNIPKEFVCIEMEVNNLNDLLTLIDKHPYDSSKEYNINLKALHKMKQPLIDLNSMVGMKKLKESVIDQIIYYLQDFHKIQINKDAQLTERKKDTGDFMHTVIYGSPGTGKTEIAKIIGQIFANLGVLSKGTFKKVTRSDLIAGYLGQTALKTRDAIKEAMGGVLFIDEAYALGNTEKRDSFSKECIDTLCEALSDHKDDLMVIVAGYETELNECFFNYNQGLNSRFTWRYKTDDYTADDMHKIFSKKVLDNGWDMLDEQAVKTSWFESKMDYFKFYGRDIETLLAKTKIAHSRRVFCKPLEEKRKLTVKDLEKGFEIYLKNDEVKKRKESTEQRNRLTSLYV
jgi:hypothetical protein